MAHPHQGLQPCAGEPCTAPGAKLQGSSQASPFLSVPETLPAICLQYLRFLVMLTTSGLIPGQMSFVDVVECEAVSIEPLNGGCKWNVDGESLPQEAATARVSRGAQEYWEGCERVRCWLALMASEASCSPHPACRFLIAVSHVCLTWALPVTRYTGALWRCLAGGLRSMSPSRARQDPLRDESSSGKSLRGGGALNSERALQQCGLRFLVVKAIHVPSQSA